MTDFSEYELIDAVGWVFETEEAAQAAVEACNVYHNYVPWCRYYPASYDDPVFWFIQYKDSIEEVLGPPVDFTYYILV